MAIKPPSDLILDVVRAANPQEYQAVIKKLRQTQTAQTSFKKNDFAKLSGEEKISNNGIAALSVSKLKPTTGDVAVYKKFEAFILQNFIENMFTSDTSSVFGKGLAGDYWKSMMAEQIANEMAEAGGIGIAKIVEKNTLSKNTSPKSDFNVLEISEVGEKIKNNDFLFEEDHVFSKEFLKTASIDL